jgi:ABC-2 type transport system permease protein
MVTLVDLLRLFYLNSKMKVLSGMQYRFDFFLGLFVAMGLSSLGPILHYLIFIKMKGYPGWNLDQIILFQGMMLLWLGIKDLLFGEIRGNMEALIKGGGFDRLMLKPYPVLGLIMIDGFYYQGVGTVIAGLAVVLISIKRLALILSLCQIGVVIGFFCCGILLYMAVTVIYCAIAILIVHMGRLSQIFDRLLEFSRYPVEVFAPWVRLIAVVMFPVALWGYFPAQTALNRLNAAAFISISSCLLIFLLSIKLWQLSLKRYTSAGG